MKKGDLVNYAPPDSPLSRFRRNGGVVTEVRMSAPCGFGTIVYWFQDMQHTREMGKHLVVISEKR
jgi:hypothetical protein